MKQDLMPRLAVAYEAIVEVRLKVAEVLEEAERTDIQNAAFRIAFRKLESDLAAAEARAERVENKFLEMGQNLGLENLSVNGPEGWADTVEAVHRHVGRMWLERTEAIEEIVKLHNSPDADFATKGALEDVITKLSPTHALADIPF